MPTALPQVHIPELALQASIFDIFTFPAYQQALLNEVEFFANTRKILVLVFANLEEYFDGILRSLLEVIGFV